MALTQSCFLLMLQSLPRGAVSWGVFRWPASLSAAQRLEWTTPKSRATMNGTRTATESDQRDGSSKRLESAGTRSDEAHRHQLLRGGSGQALFSQLGEGEAGLQLQARSGNRWGDLYGKHTFSGNPQEKTCRVGL